MSWIDLVGGEIAAPEWHDIAVRGSGALVERAQALAQQLGCYVKPVDGDAVAFVEREKPEIVLFDGTSLAEAVRVAERFRTGLGRAYEVDLDVNARLLVMRTRAYGGLLIREYVCPTARPQVCVLATG